MDEIGGGYVKEEQEGGVVMEEEEEELQAGAEENTPEEKHHQSELNQTPKKVKDGKAHRSVCCRHQQMEVEDTSSPLGPAPCHHCHLVA